MGCASRQTRIDHHLSTQAIELDDLTAQRHAVLRDDDRRRARAAPTDGDKGPSPLFYQAGLTATRRPDASRSTTSPVSSMPASAARMKRLPIDSVPG